MKIETLIDIMDMNSENYKKYENLYYAINDWPIEVNTVAEYYDEVLSFLKIDEINLDNIQKAVKSKIFNVQDAWKDESISELILFLKNEGRCIKKIERKSLFCFIRKDGNQ